MKVGVGGAIPVSDVRLIVPLPEPRPITTSTDVGAAEMPAVVSVAMTFSV